MLKRRHTAKCQRLAMAWFKYESSQVHAEPSMKHRLEVLEPRIMMSADPLSGATGDLESHNIDDGNDTAVHQLRADLADQVRATCPVSSC